MRILITGGGGAMGAFACRVLATEPVVDQVIAADIDEVRAQRVAEDAGGSATSMRLDISDDAVLKAALDDVDIVLSTAGPFFVHGRRVLDAAIAAGIHYLDICDDWEPTLDMLELDDAARKAGITAVIGMGASPGISNLLAVAAMNELDEVERVYTGWRAPAGMPRISPDEPAPKAAANVVHWIHNISAPIKIQRGGQLTEIWAMEEIPVTYPGRGTEPVWVCGHPEPLTIPHARPEVQESLNVMISRRGLMDAAIRIAERVKSGELDEQTGADKLLVEPNMYGDAAGPPPTFPPLFSVAEGTKDGESLRSAARALALPDGSEMGAVTGIPLAVATLMLIRGEIDTPGVHGPEIVDADIFFREMAKFAPDPPAGGPYVEVLTEPIDDRQPA
jgi:saccharopine dehydrogenase-like NADP-dependent oxidoreductase